MHYFIRQRCERIGGLAEVRKVKYAASDTCCCQLETPEKAHWVYRVWDNIQHWPFKDPLHAIMGVTRETLGNESDLHPIFVRLITDAVFKYDNNTKRKAARQYKKDKKENTMIIELAEEAVMKNKKYRKTVYNYIPNGKQVALEIEEAFQKIEELDKRYEEDAEANNLKYRKYIVQEIKDKKAGTRKMVDNLKKHAEKGCLSDPLPMEEMSIRLVPGDDTSELLRLRGTSGGESNNKETNRLVQNIGIQGAVLAYMKFLLRAYRWNLDKDMKLKDILGIDVPRELEWYLHEELKAYCIKYARIVVPAQHDMEKHAEPIGPMYNKWKEWEKIDKLIEKGVVNKSDIPEGSSLSEAHQTVGFLSPAKSATSENSTTTTPMMNMCDDEDTREGEQEGIWSDLNDIAMEESQQKKSTDPVPEVASAPPPQTPNRGTNKYWGRRREYVQSTPGT